MNLRRTEETLKGRPSDTGVKVMPARSDRVRGYGNARLSRVLLAAIALASLLVARPGLADDTAVGRDADGVYPIDNADVEMAAEEVTIR